jgi:tRNA(Phe) wybutosine-synthesizing methylase Tyw3
MKMIANEKNFDEIFKKNFDKLKSQQCLIEDASRKSSVDALIVDMVSAINNSENYFTTSSCSGRFLAFVQVYFYNTFLSYDLKFNIQIQF